MANSASLFDPRRLLAAVAAAFLLAGCAADGGQEDTGGGDLLGYEEPNDPLEVPNRFVFAFNGALDAIILKPAAVTYDTWVPPEVQDMVRNFTRNLGTPVILANDVFQGEWARAEDTLARFLINTTLTLGLGDPAAHDHPYHDEDFGQTLAVYGADHGFYLVLPVFGPSSLRDGIGRGVDWALDPLTYVDDATAFSIATAAAQGIDTRARNLERIEDLKSDSVDFYARVRSLYYQRREAAVANQGEEQPPAGPRVTED
jgi:phospholipid-binding lipoprotein MlaA